MRSALPKDELETHFVHVAAHSAAAGDEIWGGVYYVAPLSSESASWNYTWRYQPAPALDSAACSSVIHGIKARLQETYDLA